MRTLFYYKIEPFKGYIPSDKVIYKEQVWETANSIIGRELIDEYRTMRAHKGTKEAMLFITPFINSKIEAWLKGKEQKDPTQKPFYINFNYDGFDVFISRWNWKN